MNLQTMVELNNGVRMPAFGLGVFKAGSGEGTQNAVLWALESGYRLVDTAHIYRNEEEVGAALARTDVPRDEVFVTTKLWNDDQGYDGTLRAFDESLAALGLEQIDLYLMHWPVPGKRLDSWRAMEQIYESGRARAIGVSNFVRHHLDELAAHANVVPAVNQFEFHPFGQQRDAVAASRERGIAVQAYSPLTKGQRLDDPTLAIVAAEVGRSPAQVLLRWAVQKDVLVAVKSANQQRIQENADIFDFELSAAQMQTLDGLEEGLHTAWDPTNAP